MTTWFAFHRAVATCAFILGAPMIGTAAPLDPEACEVLKTKQADLEFQKAREHLAMGPVAARGALNREQIALVKSLIETDEQLYFRCGVAKPTLVLKEEPPEPDATPEPAPKVVKPKAKAKADPADKPKPKAKQADSGEGVVKPKAKTVETGSLPVQPNSGGAVDGADARPRKPVAPPKPKSDDAYRGPQTGSGLNGQATPAIRP